MNVESIEVYAGADVPAVIDDSYPRLDGTFFITSKGRVSLINHERKFESPKIDYWKNYSPHNQKMSFHIEWFHFLIEDPESFSIALPFFEKYFAQKLRPVYSEISFVGKQVELGYLHRFEVITYEELILKTSQLRQE